MPIIDKKTKKEVLEKLKKFWRLVWEDESLLGWIISLMFVFLFVKFIFFPTMSLFLGTKLPLVVVESNSMHHPGNFVMNYFGSDELVEEWWKTAGKWYEEKGILFNDTFEWPLRNGFEIGDVVLVARAKKIKIGNVIIFEANQRYPVIHRVVGIQDVNNRTVYSTKGDNNPGQLLIEVQIPEDALIGKAVLRIPFLGWVKLIFIRMWDLIYSQIRY